MTRTLPITKVCLYSKGNVGFFERTGSVIGTAPLAWRVGAEELYDVVKSLTVLDVSGRGTVTSVSYETVEGGAGAKDGGARSRLATGSLSDLLNDLKGARVRVEAGPPGAAPVEGAVLSAYTSGEGEAREMLSLLSEDGRVVPVPLRSIASLSVLDENLRRGVRDHLEALLGCTSSSLATTRYRTVSAACVGEGPRSVVASYAARASDWRVSYRLLLSTVPPSPSGSESSQGGPPATGAVLQALAVVKNQTEDDWEDVQLSLVSGEMNRMDTDLLGTGAKAPAASSSSSGGEVIQLFVKTLTGKTVTVEPRTGSTVEKVKELIMDKEGIAVGQQGLIIAGKQVEKGRGLADLSIQRARAASNAVRGGERAERTPARAPERSPGGDVEVRGDDFSDFYTFHVKEPVTVRRGHSCLVPFLSSALECRRATVYNPSVRRSSPMTALLFRNNAGVPLEGGPLVVLEEGAFVGEAVLYSLKPGDEATITYAVETGVTVAKSESSDLDKHREVTVESALGPGARGDGEPVLAAAFADELLARIRQARVHKTTYAFRNLTERAIETLCVEHFVRTGCELQTAEGNWERVAGYNRFFLRLGPRETLRFEVLERGYDETTVALTEKAVASWREAGLLADQAPRGSSARTPSRGGAAADAAEGRPRRHRQGTRPGPGPARRLHPRAPSSLTAAWGRGQGGYGRGALEGWRAAGLFPAPLLAAAEAAVSLREAKVRPPRARPRALEAKGHPACAAPRRPAPCCSRASEAVSRGSGSKAAAERRAAAAAAEAAEVVENQRRLRENLKAVADVADKGLQGAISPRRAPPPPPPPRRCAALSPRAPGQLAGEEDRLSSLRQGQRAAKEEGEALEARADAEQARAAKAARAELDGLRRAQPPS
eukprot:tig00020830_g14404.t1